MTNPEPTVDPSSLSLLALKAGPTSVIRHFFDRLQFDDILERHMHEKALGRRPKISHAHALSLMAANVLTSREPLYGVPKWTGKHVSAHFRLNSSQQSNLMNDDRIGRALDRLYEADASSLMTTVIMKAVSQMN